MVNYPVPPIVTQAKVQLLIDETAKAAKATIIQDLAKIVEVQKQVEQACDRSEGLAIHGRAVGRRPKRVKKAALTRQKLTCDPPPITEIRRQTGHFRKVTGDLCTVRNWVSIQLQWLHGRACWQVFRG